MILTAWEQWKRWACEYRNVPFVKKVEAPAGRPRSWEPFWTRSGERSFVLESGKAGRYTYVGDDPVSAATGKGSRATIVGYAEGRAASSTDVSGEPLDVVRQWMEPYRSPKVEGAPPFIGGIVGYWSYDLARSIERLPVQAEDDLLLPDYDWTMVRRLWVLDEHESALYCAVHTDMAASLAGKSADRDGGADRLLESLYRQAEKEADEMAARWREACAAAEADRVVRERREAFEAIGRKDALAIDVEAIPGIEIGFPKDRYMEAVRQIQRYIAQGDVFQVNLSVRQSRRLLRQPEAIYEWLRLVNPSPYMGLLRYPGYSVVSGSPELLVKSVGGTVETRPIAGTRPRGGDDDEDRRLAEELVANEKERAEHIMLVDLLRNDLGRASRYGTVKVTDLMVVETYSHVMHIVSHVQGKLAGDKDAFDVIAAVFPGGTITGAPKIRTMEIIEELEPVRRGPYTGSLGWIDYNGDMELNIVIRTLVARDGTGYVQSGAGIVIDSDPEREFAESLNKAKALWKAILYSESAGS